MSEKFYKKENTARPLVGSLRTCVSSIISETIGDLDSYSRAGRYIRESVGVFFDEYGGLFPESFVFSPELMLFVSDASLARYHYGQTYETDKNSPTGFKYTTGKTVVRQVQKDMYPFWVTHGGLILNAIDQNIGRNQLPIG